MTQQPANETGRATSPAPDADSPRGERDAPVGAAELTAMAAAQPGRKPIIRPSEFVAMTAALARRAPDLKAIWFDGRLDPAFREELMVAVAAANNCRQCSFAHREWALAEGLRADELAELEGMRAESFDTRKWAAIAWAQAATREGAAEVPADIEANFRQTFSAQEQADIELVTRTMNWMNRVSDTVDAALSRLRGEPLPESGLLREVIAVLIYALVTPFILAILSVKQRRNPISLIAGIRPFFLEFDARPKSVWR